MPLVLFGMLMGLMCSSLALLSGAGLTGIILAYVGGGNLAVSLLLVFSFLQDA